MAGRSVPPLALPMDLPRSTVDDRLMQRFSFSVDDSVGASREDAPFYLEPSSSADSVVEDSTGHFIESDIVHVIPRQMQRSSSSSLDAVFF